MLFSHWKMHIHSLMQHAALFPWLTCLTVATPLHEHQIHGLLQPDQQLPQKKRQVNSGSYLVTGVQDAGIAPRPEIRQLQKSSDMLNIFLLGLARFHATPQDDEHSYYQICGKYFLPKAKSWTMLNMYSSPWSSLWRFRRRRVCERYREQWLLDPRLESAAALAPALFGAVRADPIRVHR